MKPRHQLEVAVELTVMVVAWVEESDGSTFSSMDMVERVQVQSLLRFRLPATGVWQESSTSLSSSLMEGSREA